jgi:hypothetical protein
MVKAKTKPDGIQYWSYILIYMNNLLIVGHGAEGSHGLLVSITLYSLPRPGSVKEPDL